ncbi:MAG: R3H domain-containing nucleic acid-binding protein [Acidobacteriota bacterium]|nr:R3H domain-containing nucleic acid-binding protein [Acidobacteriota bacterium]
MEDEPMLTPGGNVRTVDADAGDEFAQIRKHYESADGLNEEDLDKVADLAITYVRDIIALFGEKHVTIDEYEGDEGELILDISGGDLAVLIGRHGRTLDAFQVIVTTFMSNKMKFHYPIVIDIEGYKSRRKDKLINLAHSAAARAKRQRGRVSLPPMNAYERRIVHLALLDDTLVTTHSEGEDPERRVVITCVRS